MMHKQLQYISGIVTGFGLFLAGVFCFVIMIVALNGVMDGRATVAMVVFGISQIFILGLGGILAGWAAQLLVEKFKWAKFSAGFVAVITCTALGAIISCIAVITSILVAGIK